jgi:NAD(P)-dependent dehydrogenase (short-subunit alcohol dehydrogenase family)
MLNGEVALITGAARGQGRSHAIRLAEAGARIIAVDICHDIPVVPYGLSSWHDMEETVELVKRAGGEVAAFEADVRDVASMQDAIEAGTRALGGDIDIVVANAGISAGHRPVWQVSEEEFEETIAVNLRGVWLTLRLTVPGMVARKRGGAIVLTSSYAGLMRSFAAELAPHRIRVNSVHPAIVLTSMVDNQATYDLFAGHPDGTREEMRAAAFGLHALPVPWIEPRDVSDAVLWLVSDQARYVTGVALPVDAGGHIAFKAAPAR